MALRGDALLEGYGGKDMPLAAYAGLIGAYGLLLAGMARRLRGRDARAFAPRSRDLFLLGAATHKLTRIVAKDWVTSPFRAPFTQYQRSAPGGEVVEKPRGTGMRRAIGQLVTCPYCMGPWVALALVYGYVAKPTLGRVGATVFASVAVSDFLHRSYALVADKRKALQQHAAAPD